MTTFRAGDQNAPPPATRMSKVAIMRFEHIYEVDPALMTEHVRQQHFPNWDTQRIAASRHDYLNWMSSHWATTVVSGEELLRDE